jgi:hypothetical protein
MRYHRVLGCVALSVATMLTAGPIGAAIVRAADIRSESLVFAVYDGRNTAAQAFKTMKSATRTGTSRQPSSSRRFDMLRLRAAKTSSATTG